VIGWDAPHSQATVVKHYRH